VRSCPSFTEVSAREMAIDRRSKPSFVLRGRRLTFGLMVQPEALRGALERAGALLERAGTLPRGTGFIARFLIAWPGSTQGTRAYRAAPGAMPQVALFGARIRELLAQPLVSDAHGCLTPEVIDLSPQARAEWIRFHDEVERELGARGALRGVRDVAAKAAENAARLAALFHVLEHGAIGTIASEVIRAAACIVGWHLNEAQRLLAHLDTPPSLAAAIRLDDRGYRVGNHVSGRSAQSRTGGAKYPSLTFLDIIQPVLTRRRAPHGNERQPDAATGRTCPLEGCLRPVHIGQ